MTDWVGRTAPELAAGASTPTGLYCWLRASGKSAEQAVEEIAQRSGYTADYNISRLAAQCARAEEAERRRASKPEANTSFHAEALNYQVLRAGGGMSRREAVEQVAKHFGHGQVNRSAFELAACRGRGGLAEGSAARGVSRGRAKTQRGSWRSSSSAAFAGARTPWSTARSAPSSDGRGTTSRSSSTHWSW